METIDIDYGSLGIGLLLMLIPVYFLWHFKTGLLKPVLIGTGTYDYTVVFDWGLSSFSV